MAALNVEAPSFVPNINAATFTPSWLPPQQEMKAAGWVGGEGGWVEWEGDGWSGRVECEGGRRKMSKVS